MLTDLHTKLKARKAYPDWGVNGLSPLVDRFRSLLLGKRSRQWPESGRVPHDWADCLTVLELRSRSDSLHFRAYAEPIGEGSVLDWTVHRFRRASANASEVYIWADRPEIARAAAALAEDTPAQLWRSSANGTAFEDLYALVRKGGKSRLVVVDVTAALLPLEFLAHFPHHHSENRYQATTLVQLPCTAAPVIVDADFLKVLTRGLSGLPPHSIPRDLRLALAVIEQAMEVVGGRRLPRVARLAPLSEDQQASRSWPYAVALDSPESVELLRTALARCAVPHQSPEASVEPLDHWNEALRTQREARLADLRPHRHGCRTAKAATRNVLFVQSPSAFSGGEQVLVHLAAGIARDLAIPFKVGALVALAGVLTDRLAQAGVDMHIAGRDFAQDSVEHFLFSRRLLEKLRPAIVHAHTVAGVPFGCVVAEHGVPFVQHVHVAEERALRSLADQLVFASAVIAISDFVKQRVIRLGIDASKIQVIRNGIPFARTQEPADARQLAAARSRTRQALGLGEGIPLILMVARFAANKRHDVAFDAFALLRNRLPAAHMLLAGEAFRGDRPVVEAAERRIKRLRIQDRIHRLGFYRDMPSLYAVADVLLLPSENDPLPLTVLEGMAARVPVVGARSGGTPEMIEHGISGLLVAPGDAEGFASAVAQILTDKERRESLIAGGFGRCRSEFSLSRFVRQVARLYERVLAGEHVTAEV